MSSNRFIKFWPTTIAFILGLFTFFGFQSILHLSFWYLIVWINLFLIVQFCGAYFIGLNFHVTSINHLNTSEKKVLLTFDDGPHNPNTYRVLEVLKKHQVKAIFFVIGKNISGNEELMKRIVAEGHQLGNHSYSHHNWIDVWSAKKVTEDFLDCQKLIQSYQPNKLFRPPYGVTNPNIAKAVKSLNLVSVGWNVRSYDTSIKNIEKVEKRVLARLKPGAVILLHDRLDFMPELLDSLIPAIRKKGYEFASAIPQ
jgi:peptidoglycan/xylan/chitin deacetylase (PgdA/CDA1 family)